MSSNSDHSNRLDGVLAEYMRRIDRGETVDPQRLIEEHPDIAVQLREYLEAAGAFRKLVDDSGSNGSIVDATLDFDPAVGRAPHSDTSPISGQESKRQSTVSEKIRYFGDYEVIQEIARGGMGVVFRAKQISLNRTVALKMILAGQLADVEAVERFHSEAEAAANLDHPGIVPIYEIGEHQGQQYFSMAYIDGPSLSDCLKDGPKPAAEAAELLRKVAEAIAYANEQGVIHRDLKPGNVLIDSNGEPRVTDFGLAKQTNIESDLTATGQILGTPSFMPPEQASGKTELVDARADVYSLGAILYQAVTGRPPFQAASPLETLQQVLIREAVPPRQLNSSVPRDLDTICLKCLRKDISERYGSARQLAEDLKRFLLDQPILARPVTRIERAWKWCRRRPALASTVGGAFFILLLGAFIVWERQNAARALGLVEALVSADTREVPGLLNEVEKYRHWTRPELNRRTKDAATGSDEQLHLALALIGSQPSQFAVLRNLVREARPNQLKTIGDVLSKHDIAMDPMWEDLSSDTIPAEQRFNIACVLAAKTPEDERWVRLRGLLASQLVSRASRSLRDASILISLLHPIRRHLSEPIGKLARDLNATTLTRDTAVEVLIEYASDQPHTLADVLLEMPPQHFERIYSVLATHGDRSATILFGVAESSVSDLNARKEWNRLVARQALAVISLLRMGRYDLIAQKMTLRPDPAVESWLIARATDYGIELSRLVELIESATAIEGRDWLNTLVLQILGHARQPLDSDMRTILLPILRKLYRNHPNPQLHAVTRWLLQQLDETGIDEIANDISELEQELHGRGPEDYRRWYVTSQGQTMVLLDSGKFLMGSSSDLKTSPQNNETRHQRVIDRRIAMSATETTVAQYVEFLKDRQGEMETPNRYRFSVRVESSSDDCPAVALNWYQCAEYCNWLSFKEGIPEAQWCYEPNDSGKFDHGMRSKRDYLLLTGYRLPTESEWEFACRAASKSSFSNGSSESRLGQVAWYKSTAGNECSAVAHLLPNRWGLFDMHGNAAEWCDDIWRPYAVRPDGVVVDGARGTPIMNQMPRLLRGGSVSSEARQVTAWYRRAQPPNNRLRTAGFRVARTMDSHANAPATQPIAIRRKDRNPNFDGPCAVQWKRVDSGTSQDLYKVAHYGGTYVAAGNRGALISSTDGESWSVRKSGTTHTLRGIAGGNGRWLAAGGDSLSGSRGRTKLVLLSSQDNGVTWSGGQVNFASQYAWNVDFLHRHFVVVTFQGFAFSSSDGMKWQAMGNAGGTTAFGTALFKNTYVVPGYQGVLSLLVPGLRHWQSLRVSRSSLKAAAHNEDRIVVVGNSGQIFTSTAPSEAWTRVESGTTSSLLDVAYGNSRFVAVGTNGVVLSSSDGHNWIEEYSGVSAELWGITFDGSRFICVGQSGTILVGTPYGLLETPAPPSGNVIVELTKSAELALAEGHETVAREMYGQALETLLRLPESARPQKARRVWNHVSNGVAVSLPTEARPMKLSSDAISEVLKHAPPMRDRTPDPRRQFAIEQLGATLELRTFDWYVNRIVFFSRPQAARYSLDGHLYVGRQTLSENLPAGGIFRVSLEDGSAVRVAESRWPVGLSVDPSSGDVLFSENGGQLYRWQKNTEERRVFIEKFATSDDPYGLKIVPHSYQGLLVRPGSLLVADHGYKSMNAIYEVSMQRPSQSDFIYRDDGSTGPMADPVDIAIGTTSVYVADFNRDDHGAIFRLTVNNPPTKLLADQVLVNPASICFDPNDTRLLVLDTGKLGHDDGRLLSIDPVTGEGEELMRGLATPELAGAALQLTPDGHRLFITVQGINSILELRKSEVE